MDRKTIGRYEILGELGRGAMGSVFRAKDPAMGRVVAIKAIHSASLEGDQAKEFRERFYREARAAGALSHPGIVPVFDVGEENGAPFLVMELIQGRALDAALKAGERYSLEQVCEIGRQIAEALGHAHRNGVVHRDIKPANILMTSREVYGAERPRIVDFGVAKLAEGELTSTGQLLGTPAFMAPEQFTGAPIDGRADLFSLGVMLYRMATGEQPFPGETLTAVSYKIVHTEPIPPSRLNPAVPQQLEAVILKCLAKSPGDRWQTGDALAEALSAMLPAARTTGSFATMTQPLAGETIDQVSSLRPRTMQTAPIAAAETVQSYPGTQAVHSSQPTFRQQPPAPPPPQTSGGFSPAGTAVPPAPAQFAPRVSPSVPAAETAQSYPGAQPVQRSQFAAAPQPPVQQAPAAPPLRVSPSVPVPAPPLAERSWPAAARPAPSVPPAPLAQTQPAQVTAAPAQTPAAYPAHTEPLRETTSTVNRTHPPAPPARHPDAGMLPAQQSVMTTRSRSVHASMNEKPGKKKGGMSPLVWLLFIVIAGGGAWAFMQLHVQQSTDNPDGGPATAAPAGAAPAPVDFNPKTLDPKSSTRLSLDLDSLPAALAVTVQMDGTTYWSGTAGDHDAYNGLRVPAGQHSFQVVVNAGGAPRRSGDVSALFEPGKHMTMGVKLWPENHGAFDPSSNVIVSMERNLF